MLKQAKKTLNTLLIAIIGLTAVHAGQVKAEGVATSAEDAVSEPTVQEILLDVCESRNYGEDCARHLLGMLWKESNNKATAIGDRGKARGYFQIHVKLHKVTLECAEDLRCSAEWSLSYLERNHYPKYVNHAIQCHNGCFIDNGYAASARRHGVRLWPTPLALNSGAKPAADFKIAALKK